MTTSVKQRSGHHKGRREALILVAAFAIPAVVLLPFVHLRTGFVASLRTGSIQFRTSGRPGKSAGIFNSDIVPVNLTIERFDRIEAGQGSSLVKILNKGGQGSVTFTGAKFHSLDVQQSLDVSLLADDGKLFIAVEPALETKEAGKNAIATAITNGETQVSCDECVAESSDGKPISESDITGANLDGSPRTWSVYHLKDNRLHLQLSAKNGIAAEREISLAKNSSVTFDVEGQSALSGTDGVLQFSGVDMKPIKLTEGKSFVVRRLQGDPEEDDPQIVSLIPEAAALKVDLHGSSNRIVLGSSNEAATPAEYLTSQKPLAAYLSTVALIGSTILTILTRLKFIKRDD
jgi:hypothetical protein